MTTPAQHRPTRPRRLSTATIRRRTGNWTTFERLFQPVIRDDGSLLWDRSELPAEIVAEQWWTVLDCEGKLYLSPGFHFVNRLGYVRCMTPWTDVDQLQPDYRYD